MPERRTSKTLTSRWFLPAVLFGVPVVQAQQANAAEYYVSPTGSDANAGTKDLPFANLQKGNDVAAAGDTIWIRGGTYTIVNGASNISGVAISKSGQSANAMIKFWAYPGEVPIFDFSQWKSSSSAQANGIYVTGNWVHIRGLEIRNLPQAGTYTNSGLLAYKASNDIFEQLHIHNIGGPGLFISHGNGGHQILNCDSHDNYDSKSSQGAGENADGFGVHYQDGGPSTIVRGCRAWFNSDDGYDLISQEYPVTLDSSWAVANGFINSGMTQAKNGNGFKAGSSKTGIRHLIKNCVAWRNGAAGFYANHSSGGNTWYNNTALNNGTAFNMLASSPDDSSVTIILSGDKVHRMRNNIGFPDKNQNMNGVDTSFNTWDLKITPKNDDFLSVSDTGFMGPRQADGSLPVLDFMKLRAGSQMIDKGTDVGLPIVGAAADLGAYEYGSAANTGAAGGSGSGGNAGVAGNFGGAGNAGTSSGGRGGNSATGGGGQPGSGGAVATGGSASSSGGGTQPGTGGGGIIISSSGGGPVSTGTGGGPSATGGVSGGTGGQTVSVTPAGDGGGCSCATVSTGRDSVLSLLTLAGLVLSLGRARSRRCMRWRR